MEMISNTHTMKSMSHLMFFSCEPNNGGNIYIPNKKNLSTFTLLLLVTFWDI